MTGRHLADRVLPPLVVLAAALAVVHTATRLPLNAAWVNMVRTTRV